MHEKSWSSVEENKEMIIINWRAWYYVFGVWVLLEEKPKAILNCWKTKYCKLIISCLLNFVFFFIGGELFVNTSTTNNLKLTTTF